MYSDTLDLEMHTDRHTELYNYWGPRLENKKFIPSTKSARSLYYLHVHYELLLLLSHKQR